jgi:murein hydrolase activator
LHRHGENSSVDQPILRPRRTVSRAHTVLLVLMVAVPTAAYAVDPPAATLPADDVKKRLEMRRSELDATENRAKFILGDLTEIKQERDRLNAKLVETAGLIQKSEGRLTAIEDKLVKMQSEELALRETLSRNQSKISKLLSALQRMGRNPPPVLFTQRSDALQMVRSAMLLASAFPELRGEALALATKLNALINVVADIKTERDTLQSETTRLSDARTRLAGLMDSKKQSLTARQGELDQVRTSAADIAKSVNDLNELMGKIDQSTATIKALGNYEAETAAAIAAAPPDTAPPAPIAKPAEKPKEVAVLAPKPPALRPSVVELAPTTSVFGADSPGRIKPAMAFHLAKAKLPLPAQGRRVIQFGDKTQYGGQSKGIVVETRPGAQITSPCDGWIVYAGEFRSYGQLLIINAGGGYHILLAGLSQIDAQPGQFVLAAEPVGTMSGSSVSAQAKSQTNSPVLYVEFRKDGRPIDPDPWWVEGQNKVQG